MKVNFFKLAFLLFLTLSIVSCSSETKNDKPTISIVINIENDDVIFDFENGTEITDKHLYPMVPYGYGVENFIVDGVKVGNTLTIDDSLIGKTITLELYQLNFYTVTVVYVVLNSDDHIDNIILEIPEGYTLQNFPEIYYLKDYYRIQNYFSDEALTKSFDTESYIDQAYTIYVTIEKSPTHIITLISNTGETYITEYSAGTIVNPVGFLNPNFAEEINLPYEKKVEGIYTDQAMTKAIERLTFDDNKTLYINVVDKEKYQITFDATYFGKKIYEIYEGEEFYLKDYKIADELREYFDLSGSYNYFKDPEFTNPYHEDYLTGSDFMIYVYFIKPIIVDISFYDGQTFIKNDTLEITYGESLLDNENFSFYLFNHFFQYEIDLISSESSFTVLINPETQYNGLYDHLYIRLEKLPQSIITLNLIHAFDQSIEQHTFEFNTNAYIGLLTHLYPNLVIDGKFYLDALLNTPLENDILNEDIELYAYGYINKEVTVTFIYESNIDPYKMTYYPLTDDFNYSTEVIPPIYELEGEYVYNIQFWLGEEHTIPVDLFNGVKVTKDATIYITYYVENPT